MSKVTRNPAELAAPEAAPRSAPVRWLVLGCFVALLALVSGSGVAAFHLLGDLQSQQEALTRALGDRTQTLSSLISSLAEYNEAIQQLARDARDRDQEVRRRLDQLSVTIATDLSRYPGNRDSDETALLAGMHDVFEQQRMLYISIQSALPDERHSKSLDSVAERIAPLQKEILAWSGRLHAWNGQKQRDADRSLLAQFGQARAGLARSLAIGLGSGLVLVLISMAYIVKLERQTHNRYVELAQSRRELQQLSSRLLDAQETERRSIARELHDEVGQALGALLVDIGRLSSAVAGDHPQAGKQLETMRSVTERTIQEVRNIALLLRPSMLDDLGLVAALEWQGREVSRRSEIEVEVESNHVSDQLPDEYRVCIYRLVQEALNNTVRHSGARTAKVTVSQGAAAIIVRVTDDGRGFDPKRTRGLGILGMEERVKRLSGVFGVESGPNRGTTIIADLPFPFPAGDRA
jgi:signal transduction histidine kinase